MNKPIILLLTILSACASTKQVAWKTGVTHAEIKLPTEAKTVVILNRVRLAYPYNRANSTLQNPNTPSVVNSAISGVRNRLNNQQHLKTLGTYTNYLATASGKFPQLLSSSDLKNISRGSDLVLVLAMFSQSISDDYKLEIRRESLGNNTYREVDHFIGKRSIPVKLGWRLYEVKSGNLIDQWEQTKDYYYEAESTERLRATNLLDVNYQKELNNLGNYHGIRYASRISPTSHIRSMEIFTSGSTSIAEGYKYVRADEWDKAVNAWISGIKTENKGKIKAMLYHNLAISAERSGDNSQARKYAKKAAIYHPLGAKTQSLLGF